MENVGLNISITGSAEAVSAIRSVADAFVKAGDASLVAAKETNKLAGAISRLEKVLAPVAKNLASMGRNASAAAKGMEELANSAQMTADAVKMASGVIGRQTQLLGENAAAAKAAAAAEEEFRVAQKVARTPTLSQTTALENQTRALILSRDAAIKSLAAHQKLTDNFASNAPKLTRTALYMTGGIAGAAYEGIKQYMQFNTKMTQTFTQAGVAFNKQKGLTQDMSNIAKQTGRNFNDVADSLYRVASATSGMNNGAGASRKELRNLVRETANLQVLGNLAPGAQSEQAARIMGAIVNSGIAGSNTKKIAAQANAIVGAGDIRMSEFITALGRGVLTSGKSVGLDLKQVGAYIDLLTSRGTTGASAGTYVAHAFQLLAGSTTQAANWQKAIGLQGGEMTTTMKKKGLNAAVQLLYTHMQKLDTSDPNNVKMMQKAGLSEQEISAWSAGLTPGSDMQTAVLQRAMSAMFGGGRQAMPLITLMQSAGIDTSGLTKGNFEKLKKGDKPPSYKEILDAIEKHSTMATYNKALQKVNETPQVREQKLLRSLQWDLIQFGKTMTPVWLGILKAGTLVLGFLGKFKGYLVEIGLVIAGILGAVAIKQVAKLAIAAKKFAGAGSYWTSKALGAGAGKERKLGKWASEYANEKMLKGSAAYDAAIKQIAAADRQIEASQLLLRAAGSQEMVAQEQVRLLRGQDAKLAEQTWRDKQLKKQSPWSYGADEIYPTGTKHRRPKMPNAVQKMLEEGAPIIHHRDLRSIREQARVLTDMNIATVGKEKRFNFKTPEQKRAMLQAEMESALIHKKSPVQYQEHEIKQLTEAYALKKMGGSFYDPKTGRIKAGRAEHEAFARQQLLGTGQITGMGMPLRTIAQESARTASFEKHLTHTADTAIIQVERVAEQTLREVGGVAGGGSGIGGGGGGGSQGRRRRGRKGRRGLSQVESDIEDFTRGRTKTQAEHAAERAAERTAGRGVLGTAEELAGGIIPGGSKGSGIMGLFSKVGGLFKGGLGGIVGGGAEKLAVGGLLKGAAMGGLGLLTGGAAPLTMMALTTLGPMLAPAMMRGAASAFRGISNFFGGGGPAAPPPPPSTLTPAGQMPVLPGGPPVAGVDAHGKPVPITAQKWFKRIKDINKQMAAAKAAGDWQTYYALKHEKKQDKINAAAQSQGGPGAQQQNYLANLASVAGNRHQLKVLKSQIRSDSKGGYFLINGQKVRHKVMSIDPNPSWDKVASADGNFQSTQEYVQHQIDAQRGTASNLLHQMKHPGHKTTEEEAAAEVGRIRNAIRPRSSYTGRHKTSQQLAAEAEARLPKFSGTGSQATKLTWKKGPTGKFYSPELDRLAHKADPWKFNTKDKTIAGAFAGGDFVPGGGGKRGSDAMVSSLSKLIESAKHGTPSQNKATLAAVMHQAGVDQKRAAGEAMKGMAEMKAGHLNAAKKHIEAAQHLQDSSNKLKDGAAKISDGMHIKNADELGRAVAVALKDSGIGNEADVLKLMNQISKRL